MTPIIHFASFYPFELTKVSSFYHSSNWWTTDSSLFGSLADSSLFYEVLRVCEELLLVNKSVFIKIGIFFCCYWPRLTRTFFSIHGVTTFKVLQKSFYGCVSPVFRQMVFRNFIRRPTFFFIIILDDDFVFFWKHHCEQIVTKSHCEQRGSLLTIYSSVMWSNASKDTALYFLGKTNLNKAMKGNKDMSLQTTH